LARNCDRCITRLVNRAANGEFDEFWRWLQEPPYYIDKNGLVALPLRESLYELRSDAAQFGSLIEPRCIKNCIYPQWQHLDTGLPQTELNIGVLYELGRRARRREDPLYRIEQYIAAVSTSIGACRG
jgi:hypothetical protein